MPPTASGVLAPPMMPLESISDEQSLKRYFKTKIEEAQHKLQEKQQNVRRLQAQRNELNSKVRYYFLFYFAIDGILFHWIIVRHFLLYSMYLNFILTLL